MHALGKRSGGGKRGGREGGGGGGEYQRSGPARVVRQRALYPDAVPGLVLLPQRSSNRSKQTALHISQHRV
eukprot:586218-Hanusia_phi.AAC.2